MHLQRIAFVAVAFSIVSATQAQPAPKPDALAENSGETPVTLDVFTVRENSRRAYGSSNLASATRLNTPAENVPQSISVVNAALLRDIGAYGYDQAMRYTPGVTQRQNVFDGSVIRGFLVGNRYRNGFLVPGYESDLVNIDRIEVIKGPSASIAGSSESGGFVNFITKRPGLVEETSAAVTVGSRGFVRGVIDATGPIAGTPLAYRLNVAQVNSDTWRDLERVRKTAIYPSLLWTLSRDTQLLVELEYFDGLTPSGFGLPYLAPTFNNTATPVIIPAGVTPKIGLGRWGPTSLNTSGEPGMGRSINAYSAFTTLTHRFNDVFSARQAVSYVDLAIDAYRAAVGDPLAYDANGDLFFTRTSNRTVTGAKVARFQGDLAARHNWFANKLGLTALLGYDLGRSKNTGLTSAGVLQNIIVASPVYGLPPLQPLSRTVDNNSKGGSFGYFANVQLSGFDDRVILTGGLRRDQNKASWTRNNFTGAYTNVPTSPRVESPLYGLTIKPIKALALYAVKSEAGAASSVRPIYSNIPLTDARQILVTVQPLTTNDEFGLKLNLLDGAFAINLAHYKIVQNDNVRNQTDNTVPGGAFNIVENGNVAKGWELEFSGNVTRQLALVGGYARVETSAAGFKPNGAQRELRGMPEHKFQGFARYDFAATKDRGFAVRAGIVYQTSVWGRAENTYRVPGATRFDLGFDYRRSRWIHSLTVENLSDVIFPQAAIGQGSNTVDAPRTVYFTTAYKF